MRSSRPARGCSPPCRAAPIQSPSCSCCSMWPANAGSPSRASPTSTTDCAARRATGTRRSAGPWRPGWACPSRFATATWRNWRRTGGFRWKSRRATRGTSASRRWPTALNADTHRHGAYPRRPGRDVPAAPASRSGSQRAFRGPAPARRHRAAAARHPAGRTAGVSRREAPAVPLGRDQPRRRRSAQLGPPPPPAASGTAAQRRRRRGAGQGCRRAQGRIGPARPPRGGGRRAPASQEDADGSVRLDAQALGALPAALARRVVRAALDRLDSSRFRGFDHVEQVLAIAGAAGGRAAADLPGVRVERNGAKVVLYKRGSSPRPASPALQLRAGGAWPG